MQRITHILYTYKSVHEQGVLYILFHELLGNIWISAHFSDFLCNEDFSSLNNPIISLYFSKINLSPPTHPFLKTAFLKVDKDLYHKPLFRPPKEKSLQT